MNRTELKQACLASIGFACSRRDDDESAVADMADATAARERNHREARILFAIPTNARRGRRSRAKESVRDSAKASAPWWLRSQLLAKLVG